MASLDGARSYLFVPATYAHRDQPKPAPLRP